jgi:hypothetical protein
VSSEGLGVKIVHSSVAVALGCHHDAVNVCVLDHASPATAAQQLATLVSNLMQLASGMPVILKKVPDELAEYLQRDSAFVGAADRLSYWQLEDDAFPETSIQLGGLCEAVARGADNVRALRRQIRRFEREGIALICVRSFSISEGVEALRQLSGSVTDKYEAYLGMVRSTMCASPPDVLTWLFATARAPHRYHGIYIAHPLGADDLGLYCGLSSRSFGGITEWMDMYVFKDMLCSGYHRALFGGAETEGVARYIEKFLPTPPRVAGTTLIRKG